MRRLALLGVSRRALLPALSLSLLALAGCGGSSPPPPSAAATSTTGATTGPGEVEKTLSGPTGEKGTTNTGPTGQTTSGQTTTAQTTTGQTTTGSTGTNKNERKTTKKQSGKTHSHEQTGVKQHKPTHEIGEPVGVPRTEVIRSDATACLKFKRQVRDFQSEGELPLEAATPVEEELAYEGAERAAGALKEAAAAVPALVPSSRAAVNKLDEILESFLATLQSEGPQGNPTVLAGPIQDVRRIATSIEFDCAKATT